MMFLHYLFFLKKQREFFSLSHWLNTDLIMAASLKFPWRPPLPDLKITQLTKWL